MLFLRGKGAIANIFERMAEGNSPIELIAGFAYFSRKMKI
jgi:hypothetical protein